MTEAKRYKCIKEMELQSYDDNGFVIENKYRKVKVGSVWSTPDIPFMIIGGEESIHLDRESTKGYEWCEIYQEHLEEYFEEIK